MNNVQTFEINFSISFKVYAESSAHYIPHPNLIRCGKGQTINVSIEDVLRLLPGVIDKVIKNKTENGNKQVCDFCNEKDNSSACKKCDKYFHCELFIH